MIIQFLAGRPGQDTLAGQNRLEEIARAQRLRIRLQGASSSATLPHSIREVVVEALALPDLSTSVVAVETSTVEEFSTFLGQDLFTTDLGQFTTDTDALTPGLDSFTTDVDQFTTDVEVTPGLDTFTTDLGDVTSQLEEASSATSATFETAVEDLDCLVGFHH